MEKETLQTLLSTPNRAGVGGNPQEYTLDSLVPLLGAFDETVRTVIYNLVSEQELFKEGKRVASDRILDDAPLFLGSAHGIWRGLSESQRKRVNIEEHLFALCLDESLKLRELRDGHQVAAAVTAGGRAGRRVTRSQVLRALRASRRSMLASLKNGLDKASLAHAKALAGTAARTVTLIDGSERLADYVAQRIADAAESERARLRSFNLTTERVAELRSHVAAARATRVATTRGGRIEQRLLDIQDGRVLFLMERIVRAFRAAQNEDPTILVPELRALANHFAPRRSGRGPKTPTPPKTPPTRPAPSALSVSANPPGTRRADGTNGPPPPPADVQPAEK